MPEDRLVYGRYRCILEDEDVYILHYRVLFRLPLDGQPRENSCEYDLLSGYDQHITEFTVSPH